jgi:hypothetical protein
MGALVKESHQEEETRLFPPELEFLHYILDQETAVPDEIETSDLFLKIKFTEYLTMFFTVIGILNFIV